MLLTASLSISTVFIVLIGCNGCKVLPAANESNEVPKLHFADVHSNDSGNVDTVTTAVLTKPTSRDCNCIASETSYNCDVLVSDEGESDETVDGVDGWRTPSQLKIRAHNETHFATDIAWTFNKGAVIIDNARVFLANGDHTSDQSIQKSSLNLLCSYENNERTGIENHVFEFVCHVENEFVESLLYEAAGSGVLLATLKLINENDEFHRVADVSLNDPVERVVTYHGFVSEPLSRAKLCQRRINKDCGLIVYEPQSIEGFKGFPHASYSPPDGKIASGNNRNFDELNEYGEDRWVRVKFPDINCHNATHVSFDLSWHFTALHSTDNIRVYVSNENYTQLEPLSRRHLDLDPLCAMEFHGKRPPWQLTMVCPVSLEKYRELSVLSELLILSVWNVYDTSFAFYQVIDLEGLSAEQSYENVVRKCGYI